MRPQLPHVALALALLAGSSQVPAIPGQAQAVLAQARAAIGGEERLQAVKSLSLKGLAGTAPTAFTNLQIDFLLPDRFLISRNRAYFRRVGGYNWKELIEQRWQDGLRADVRPADPDSDAYAWQMAARRRECARYLVAWLLMAPAEYGVQFTDDISGDKADARTDIVDAKGANEMALRLFFDKTTHLLVKLTYREQVPTSPAVASRPEARPVGERGEPLFTDLKAPEAKSTEVTMEFSEHHADDGIVFPHKVRIDAQGLQEEWQISRFRVNPPLDAKDFERK